MDTLQKARETINQIDRAMADLFVQRMRAVEDVIRYKQEHSLPIFDPAREAEVIKRNSQQVPDSVLQPYYIQFLQDVMDISKQYQHDILNQHKGNQ